MSAKRLLKIAGGCALALLLVAAAWGYVFIKDDRGYIITWPPGTIPVQIKLATSPALSDGTSQSGSVMEAINAWNARVGTVQFSAQQLGPGIHGSGNGINEIVMDSMVEGEAFGENVLAVTVSHRDPSNGNRFFESDIIFNSAFTWDSYRGSLRVPEDIRRVAIHELGHVLGLDHPDQASPHQDVVAIMNSTVSSIDFMQPDDVTGAQSLYGAPGFVPANNDFTSATTMTLAGGSVQMTGTNVAATAEAGEPALDPDDPGRRTVWWKWTAPASGIVTLNTFGSNFDTLLGVFTGTAVNSLTLIALNDDVQSGVIRTSSVTFNATSGTTYAIAVDGWGGSAGSITLYLSLVLPPAITNQPANQTVTAGQTTTFSVLAASTVPLSHQWQRLAAGSGTWSDLSNGGGYSNTSATALIVNTTQSMNGDQFRCIVSNIAGSVTSNTALLTVNAALPPPTITAQPASQAVLAGATVTFKVGASGTGVLTYRWRKNGSNLSNAGSISGATTDTLTIANAQETDNGDYTVVVADSAGQVVSNAATLSVGAVPGVVAMAADSAHTLFIRADGTLWGTGSNYRGSLGDGTNTNRFAPVQVATGVVAVAIGENHMLFIKSDGSLWAAGRNDDGRLGDGTTDDRLSPVQVATGVVAASAGWRHSLFIKADGTMWGMGAGYYGELGGGVTSLALSPVQIGSGVVAVAAGNEFSLFLKSDGTLWGSGSNYFGQLGDGTSANYRRDPIAVATGVVSASAGYGSVWFLKLDGTLWGMGRNEYGQLGDGTILSRSSPVPVAAGVLSAQVDHHGLFLKANGALWGGGSNNNGELGDGTISTSVPTPKQLVGNGVTRLAVGNGYSLFIKADGGLWGMGYGLNGELGIGAVANQLTPVRIAYGPVPVPTAPLAPAITVPSVGSGIRLNWSPVIGAMSYEVWRHTANAPGSATRIASNVPIALFYDTTAISGTDYYYWIKAVNSAGAGGFSAMVTTGLFGDQPGLATQPQSQAVVAGDAAVFSVVAGGLTPFSYYWQVSAPGSTGWTDLANGGVYRGVNTATLTITGTTVGLSGSVYRCVIFNPAGYAVSDWARLTVSNSEVAPTVTSQPSSATVTAGANASFTAGVSGTPTLRYYWQLSEPGSTSWADLADGGVYRGVNTATLTITGATAGLNGNVYRCVIFNPAGYAVSDWARLTVNGALVAPGVTSQPAAAAVTVGGNANFAVGVSGSPALLYYWQVSAPGSTGWTDLADGGIYSGVHAATLTITGATAGLSGSVYRCVIFNSAGHAVSEWARLTVTTSVVVPTVDTPPTNQTVTAGGSTSFTVGVGGTAPFAYYWQVSTPGSTGWTDLTNNNIYSGTRTATLTIGAAGTGLNGYSYRCQIYNSSGYAVSNGAVLTVTGGGSSSAPSILGQPSAITTTEGNVISFMVGVNGTAPFAYYWQVSPPGSSYWMDLADNSIRIGSRSSVLTLVAITGLTGNSYRCQIFNAYGYAVTETGVLTVTDDGVTSGPIVITQPAAAVTAAGASANFTVEMSGTAPFSYYWQVSTPGSAGWTDLTNNGTYSGTRTATLTITNTAGLNHNSYRCQVFNAHGYSVSESGLLTE